MHVFEYHTKLANIEWCFAGSLCLLGIQSEYLKLKIFEHSNYMYSCVTVAVCYTSLCPSRSVPYCDVSLGVEAMSLGMTEQQYSGTGHIRERCASVVCFFITGL